MSPDPASLLARQRQAHYNHGAPGAARRRTDLTRLRRAVIDRRAAIEAAIDADFGHRSRHETAIMELAGLVSGIDYLRRNLTRLMRPDRRRVALTMMPGRARVEYQPLGVVGILSPWNYPVTLALMPLATALAAGNRVMLKPSEYTPATNAVLAAILGDLFPADQVAVIQGDATVGAAFGALPFDHLIFTGSTAVGRQVMAAASANLVPVTLELGGKSPAIVARGHDMGRAAGSIMYGKLINGGQTCIAPDYALVHPDDLDRFVAACDRAVHRAYPEGPSGRDATWIVNDRHLARLTALLDDACAKGADLRPLGDPGTDPHPRAMRPVLLLGVTDEMDIARTEIFGPILPVLTCSSLDDAIAHVNARPHPLALYYFGDDPAAQRQVLDRTTSGNVTINGTILHVAQDDLPFGGVGASGMGAYHGPEGFRRFSHAKGIYVQGRLGAPHLLRPPYGRLIERILSIVLR